MKKVAYFTKRALRRIAAELYYRGRISRGIQRGGSKIKILMYHRVLPEDYIAQNLLLPGVYVSQRVFELQMTYLAEKYQVISLEEFLARNEVNEWDRRKQYCMISFDDGWRDNFDYAFPVLKKYCLPATIFLTADFIGGDEWFWYDKLSFYLMHCQNYSAEPRSMWDMVSVAKELGIATEWFAKLLESNSLPEKREIFHFLIEEMKQTKHKNISHFLARVKEVVEVAVPHERLFLDWEEIMEMSIHGISFGSHGCTHKILTAMSEDEALSEIVRSRDTLAQREINFVPVFCYPNGEYNKKVTRMVKREGYKAGFSTRFGVVHLPATNLYELSRMGIHNDVTHNVPLFALRLSGLV